MVNINKTQSHGLSLTARIFVGLLSGLLFGIAISYFGPSYFRDDIVINGLLKLAGGLFVRAIKMLVVPLVFISLVCGACAIGDVKKLGRIGVKIMVYYTFTTALAVALALAVGVAVDPGAGLDLSKLVKKEASFSEAKPVIDTLLELIPENPAAAMARGEMLQVIFFALLAGVSMALLGPKARAAADLFNQLNEVVMKMVTLVMHFAPYGVFALIAKTFATAGIDAVLPIFKFVAATIFAMLLHVLIVYGGMVRLLARLSPLAFLRKTASVIEVAFSTSSSNATLPFTIDAAVRRIGVSKNTAAFTLPLGATVNMDGTAIMQGVAAVFIAEVYMIDLGLSAYLTIILTAALASVGTAGVPGVGMITLSMVLQSAGLPLEGIALIIGVDRIIDMFRTTVNVLGDIACTLVVAKSENEFDAGVFNSEIEDDENAQA